MGVGRFQVLAWIAILAIPTSVSGAVTGTWSNTDNNYRFHVSSDLGNITSLELSFAAAAGSTFQTEFDDIVFDFDGSIATFEDSFLLFLQSVTSPGSTQAKTSTLLQAAFTGFTPFAAKDVAQLILLGTPNTPIASTLDRDPLYLGRAVVETIAGDPNSRQEFPILGTDLSPPVVSPQIVPINDNSGVHVQLLAMDDTTPITWSDMKIGGAGKFNLGASDPTFTPDGLFSWNMSGWNFGAHTFTFDVTDGLTPNPNTANDVLALTVIKLPEPATVSLMGLAAVGLVGFARRR